MDMSVIFYSFRTYVYVKDICGRALNEEIYPLLHTRPKNRTVFWYSTEIGGVMLYLWKNLTLSMNWESAY